MDLLFHLFYLQNSFWNAGLQRTWIQIFVLINYCYINENKVTDLLYEFDNLIIYVDKMPWFVFVCFLVIIISSNIFSSMLPVFLFCFFLFCTYRFIYVYPMWYSFHIQLRSNEWMSAIQLWTVYVHISYVHDVYINIYIYISVHSIGMHV